jgi:hypothetical protein
VPAKGAFLETSPAVNGLEYPTYKQPIKLNARKILIHVLYLNLTVATTRGSESHQAVADLEILTGLIPSCLTPKELGSAVSQ